MRDGAEVYRKLVAPSRVAHERLAAQEAILSLFMTRPRELRYGDYYLRRSSERRSGDARFGLLTGRLQLRWMPTGETNELVYAVLHVGAADVCCAVTPAHSGQRDIVDAVWQNWSGQSIARLLRAIERGFGPAEYTMRDLLIEERHRVLGEVYGDLLRGVGEEYARLYDNHRHTMHVLRDAGLPIPEPLKKAAEAVLGGRFEAEIARQRRSRDPARYRRAIKMAEDARERGLSASTRCRRARRRCCGSFCRRPPSAHPSLRRWRPSSASVRRPSRWRRRASRARSATATTRSIRRAPAAARPAAPPPRRARGCP
jgi:hypothetical protein